jgi:endonuclease YncB( thermonuclease family)
MMGWWGGVWAVVLAADFVWMPGCVAAAAQKPAVAAAAPRVSCGGGEIARGRVSRVIDGSDFVLDDGREVHLAAVNVPSLPVAGDSEAAPGGRAAKAALSSLVGGAQVALRAAGSQSDRYGRIVAYVEVLRGTSQRSAEAEMISAGLARVGDDAGSETCAAELLRREDAARQAKLGLWADPYYAPIRADNPADILAQRGRFTLVEGKVVSVHASGAILYVNFGRKWSQDFAATVRKRNERNFAAVGLDLQGLAGRSVLVRGWIEAHAGNPSATGAGFWGAPWIELAHPQQIELTGADEMRVTR